MRRWSASYLPLPFLDTKLLNPRIGIYLSAPHLGSIGAKRPRDVAALSGSDAGAEASSCEREVVLSWHELGSVRQRLFGDSLRLKSLLEFHLLTTVGTQVSASKHCTVR